jgi:L-asparaginase
MKRILFINTGGTISSSQRCQGLAPTETAEDILMQIPEMQDMCRVEPRTWLSIDSTNMQPENWARLAEIVHAELEHFDGIVIAHGTDTMAYTSSALSFMLGAIDKPVILTGSQLPILVQTGDSKQNMIDAFVAACSHIQGVYIVFNGKIIKGCRAVKVRSKSFCAFESINYPYIGRIKDREITFEHKSEFVHSNHSFSNAYSDKVFLLKLTPALNPKIFDTLYTLGYKGIIIEGFGLGGIPFQEGSLLCGIERLIANSLCVAVTTQCLYEGSDLSVYEVGRKVLEKGVILCWDMTTEAIVTKMMWALGRSPDSQHAKSIMEENFVDEITIP